MLSDERYVKINVDEQYFKACVKALRKCYDEVDLFYQQLSKVRLIKVINKDWVFNPEEFDFLFKIKPDGIAGPEFSVITKATMVDLLKRRKVIQYIIVKKLTNDGGILQ